MENFLFYLIIALLINQIHLVIKLFFKGQVNNKLFYYFIKFLYGIGTVLGTVNVLYHELGHVIGAVVTKGKVYKVELNSDRGGVATTASSNNFSKIFTTLAGYPFASLVSLLFVYLLVNAQYNVIIYILVATLIGCILFLVRNAFGLTWSVIFLVLTLVVDSYAIEYVPVFVGLVTATLVVNSFTTAVYIFYLSIFNKENSGDAFNLSVVTRIPTMIWGLFFLVGSSYIVYINFNILLNSQLF